MSDLRINLDDLLHARTVESERIEFKATWAGKVTGYQVSKTIWAFANDLRRHGSGYVILGVAERDGGADLPPRGPSPERMDAAGSGSPEQGSRPASCAPGPAAMFWRKRISAEVSRSRSAGVWPTSGARSPGRRSTRRRTESRHHAGRATRRRRCVKYS